MVSLVHRFFPVTRDITSPFILWCILSYPSRTNDLILNSTCERRGLSRHCPLWASFSLAYLAIKQLCFPPLIIYLHFFFFIKQPFQYTAEPSSWIQLLQDGGSLKKDLLIHYSHFKWCNISEIKSNMKPHATHIIKSAQNINTNRSCSSSLHW